jgi:hypothetical protein
MDAAGYSPEDFDVEVWPENQRAIDLFATMQTQWRIGINGREGLDYNVLFRLLDRLKLSESEYDDLFADVRHMEAAVLNEPAKQ